ncbi:anti-sigma factor [Tropicimonas sp. IMCC6043]|uniref:anti-sigma factor family protein n=1 Tax=Tropicimonas sp. IMCC6043 TaxID=2510645 RepID=UPI00101D399A|nr:zf-HC2 domain-containing protein [Tropicimonas sp. IMCC6043]RYH07077.1 anti-sigma factor [Tropicimonas sp. IMCC6043]
MTIEAQETLNAYVDGELGPEEAAELEARLTSDLDARQTLEALSRQKRLVGDALQAIDIGPADLQTERLKRRLADRLAQRTVPRPYRPSLGWLRAGAQVAAACALIAFGWWGHATVTAPVTGVPEYVSEAVGAHQVFADDPDYPVEFAGAAVDGVADWFSGKVGVPITAPDLAEYGVALVGARLLGTKEGPLAQYIYEDDKGARYSLTLAQHPKKEPIGPLTIVDYPNRSVGYWRTADVDFALVGEGGKADVQKIAMDLSSKI